MMKMNLYFYEVWIKDDLNPEIARRKKCLVYSEDRETAEETIRKKVGINFHECILLGTNIAFVDD